MPGYYFAPALIATVKQVLQAGVPTSLSLPVDPNAVAKGLGVGGAIQPHHALITVEGYPVRWGNPPDAFDGTLVPAGGTIDFTNGATDFMLILRQIQFVSATGPAVLQIQYMS